MKYMGSKSRIAKHIVPIIQQYIDDNSPSWYIEPFCGGCNVIDKIKYERKIASDKQYYLIEFLKNLDKLSQLPKDFVTREHYSDVRNAYHKRKDHKEFEDWYIGAIGFLASYNGRFFDGGYAGTSEEKGRVRNYYDECKRNIEEQAPLLKDIIFHCHEYYAWSPVKQAVIYCDPPYKGTKQFSVSKGFDHDKFWQWCRDMSKGNIVLISEEQAPEDFEIIWSAPVKRTIKTDNKVSKIEKLYKYKGE